MSNLIIKGDFFKGGKGCFEEVTDLPQSLPLCNNVLRNIAPPFYTLGNNTYMTENNSKDSPRYGPQVVQGTRAGSPASWERHTLQPSFFSAQVQQTRDQVQAQGVLCLCNYCIYF